MPKVTGFIDAHGHVVEADSEPLDFLPVPFKRRDDLMAFPCYRSLNGFRRQARRQALAGPSANRPARLRYATA